MMLKVSSFWKGLTKLTSVMLTSDLKPLQKEYELRKPLLTSHLKPLLKECALMKPLLTSHLKPLLKEYALMKPLLKEYALMKQLLRDNDLKPFLKKCVLQESFEFFLDITLKVKKITNKNNHRNGMAILACFTLHCRSGSQNNLMRLKITSKDA